MRVAVVAVAAVALGCSSEHETNTPTAAKPAVETKATSTATEDEREGDCESKWDDAKVAASATAPFDQIDVQLDGRPTFLISSLLAGQTAFTRLPEFTLYRDGTVFYPDPANRERSTASYLTAKLDRAAADEIRARVLALGAEQLKSHVESCSCPTETARGKLMICADDAGYVIVRFRDAKGELRHVVVYAGFWNKRAVAKSIIDYLAGYRAPNAAPFVPTRATLVAQRNEGADACSAVPSAPDVVQRLVPPGRFLAVTAVEGAPLQALEAKMPAAGSRAEWCAGKDTIQARIYPTLPGMDHRPAITEYLRAWE